MGVFCAGFPARFGYQQPGHPQANSFAVLAGRLSLSRISREVIRSTTSSAIPKATRRRRCSSRRRVFAAPPLRGRVRCVFKYFLRRRMVQSGWIDIGFKRRKWIGWFQPGVKRYYQGQGINNRANGKNVKTCRKSRDAACGLACLRYIRLNNHRRTCLGRQCGFWAYSSVVRAGDS